jgi:hypothetical protein
LPEAAVEDEDDDADAEAGVEVEVEAEAEAEEALAAEDREVGSIDANGVVRNAKNLSTKCMSSRQMASMS